jgi:hypothetical protein
MNAHGGGRLGSAHGIFLLQRESFQTLVSQSLNNNHVGKAANASLAVKNPLEYAAASTKTSRRVDDPDAPQPRRRRHSAARRLDDARLEPAFDSKHGADGRRKIAQLT